MAKPEEQPKPYDQTETAQGIGPVPLQAASSLMRFKAKRPGLKQRISEAWKNRSEDLARVGIAAGILSYILLFGLLFLVPVAGLLLSLFCAIFGFVCGVRSLKSGKKELPIVAIAINIPCVLPMLIGILAVMGH